MSEKIKRRIFASYMGRILSIDYGTRRTGLAVTDPMQMIAGGLATVQTCNLETFLKDYFSKEKVDEVIIGEPRQTDGTESRNMQNVRQFINRFKKVFPSVPIRLYDERFTSVLAHQTMLDAGLGKKARQNKGLVDEISAVIILQGYMESRQFGI